MNSYEIAILRILVKKNHQPIAIHRLIDGFPDGSERQVMDAISNLENLNLVNVLSGFPIEEKYVVYDVDKKQKILKVIDPLYNKINDNRYDVNRYIHRDIIKIKINKNYQSSLLRFATKPVNISISVIFIFALGFVINLIPQTHETERFYDIYYKYFKHKNSDTQAYGNEGKQYWDVKIMNKDFKNNLSKDQFNTADYSSQADPVRCQNT